MTASLSPDEVETVSAGSAEHLEVPGERPGEPGVEAVALHRREEADLTEVHGEDRHVATGVAAQRGEDGAVAAENDRKVGIPVGVRAQHRAGELGGQAELFDLLRRNPQLDIGRGAHLRQPPHGLRRAARGCGA